MWRIVDPVSTVRFQEKRMWADQTGHYAFKKRQCGSQRLTFSMWADQTGHFAFKKRQCGTVWTMYRFLKKRPMEIPSQNLKPSVLGMTVGMYISLLRKGNVSICWSPGLWSVMCRGTALFQCIMCQIITSIIMQ